ncbi:MAG: hypothetical protein COB41_10430 [Proteobacteria bacterium]|nr:MAG: hypothetical protein COB41_10430 [Pseudomonadota bacterium]
MKPICSIITYAFFLLGIFLLPTPVDAIVCTNKTVVVFGNGMFNDVEEANASKTELQKKLMSFSQVFKDEAKYEFTLAFTSDGSQYKLNGTNPIIKLANYAVAAANVGVQVTEVVLQKVAQDNFSAFVRWTGGLAPAGSRLQSELNNLASAANSFSFLFDPDLQSQVADYTKLLNAGKRIVIISHSQGNFYANAVYSALTLNTPAWANSVGVVQVATPATSNQGSKLGNNEPQITVPEDMVMAATQLLNPWLTMPTKPVSGLSRNFLELGGTSAYLSATGGHNFVTWYLAGTDTRDFIMKGIVQTISGVNGVGGLQYPAQVCTPPVAGPVATVPQLGPYYFRDDWGALTFDLSVLEYRGYFYRKDPWGRFKNLRDEQKGLAYHVDMQFTLVNRGAKTWNFPMKTSMTITDYTSMAQQTIPLTFTGQFHPQDVLLWNGGLIFLSFDKRNNNWIGNYHRDGIVRVNWRKVSIIDNGAGVANRWVLKPVQSGTFLMPNYTVARKTWTTTPTGSAQKWGVGASNQWNKLGVAFRDAMTYTYRIPFSAAEAHWTDAPSTPFGWVNGVNVAPPNPLLKNYLGEYGVLEVIDGVLSFTSLGKAPLQSTGVQQSGQVPQINTFGGIEQTVAYQDTQGIVKKAVLVDEASQPNWRMAGTPPAAGAPALGTLKAVLPANESFFNPRTWTQTFQYAYGTYGQIFIPFSLSKQMVASLAIGINNTPLFSQRTAVYKLGAGFSFPYPAPTPTNIPRFLRRGVHTCAATVPGCTFGRIYGVSVNAAQKAFLMSPTP